MNNRQFLAYFRGYHSRRGWCNYTNAEEIEYFHRGYDDKIDGYAFGKFSYKGDI